MSLDVVLRLTYRYYYIYLGQPSQISTETLPQWLVIRCSVETDISAYLSIIIAHFGTFLDIPEKDSYFPKKWVHTGDPSKSLTMETPIFLSVKLAHFGHILAIFRNTEFSIIIAISGTHMSIFKLQWLVIRCSVETDISAYLSIIIAHFGAFLDNPENHSYFPKNWVHTGALSS